MNISLVINTAKLNMIVNNLVFVDMEEHSNAQYMSTPQNHTFNVTHMCTDVDQSLVVKYVNNSFASS